MLYIEGEPVPGLPEGASHTVYGSDTVRGTAPFIYEVSYVDPDVHIALV